MELIESNSSKINAHYSGMNIVTCTILDADKQNMMSAYHRETDEEGQLVIHLLQTCGSRHVKGSCTTPHSSLKTGNTLAC